jgi:uncharacterized protein
MADNQRIDAVDILRSFALFGICIVNLPFIAAPINTGPPIVSIADHIAEFITAWLFAGKFFLIFAFLFGWSFGVQQRSAERAGASFSGRFARRTAALAVFGLLHGWLIFSGDILLPYAIISVAFYAVHRWPDRKLLKLSAAMVPLAAVFLALLAITPEFSQPPATSAVSYGNGWLADIGQRIEDWSVAMPFIMIFNGPLVLAAFCVGLVAHRRSIFSEGNAAFDWLAARLPYWWLLGLALNLPCALAWTGLIDGLAAAAGLALLAVGAPILSLALILSVVLLTRRNFVPKGLGAAGRMSMTAYIAEGAIGTALFIGFDLFGKTPLSSILAIAAGIYITAEIACALWMKSFRQGPLEAVLRKITYGRRET